MNAILSKAKESGLPRWTIEKDKKATIVFTSVDNDERVEVRKNSILKVIEWSFSYIEVIDDPDFWTANKTHLDVAHGELIRAFLSLIDLPSVYPDLSSSIAEKEYRDRMTRCSNYRCLAVEAAKNNDLKTVSEYIYFARQRLTKQEFVEGVLPPLAYAAKNGNYEMVKMLVENGVYREEDYIYNDERRVSTTFAIENGFDEIVDLLIENPSTLNKRPKSDYFYYGDASIIKAALNTGKLSMIEKIAKISTGKIDVSRITDVEILKLLSYSQTFVFSEDQLRSVYQAGYYDAAKRMSKGTQSMYY